VQKEGEVIHIVARELVDLTPWLKRIGDADLETTKPLMLSGGQGDDANPPRLRVKSRDFH